MGSEKIKGKMKQAGAAMRGNAGILNTLMGEHAEVSSLIKKVKGDVEAAREHYPTIRKELLAHAHAEQRVFYDACQKNPETASFIPDAKSDHRDIENLLADLDQMPLDAPAWMETLERLETIVTAHVEDEENELFAQCRESFDSAELRDLDDVYKQAKDEIANSISDEPSPFHHQEAGRPIL